jgi:hypothetical protein
MTGSAGPRPGTNLDLRYLGAAAAALETYIRATVVRIARQDFDLAPALN